MLIYLVRHGQTPANKEKKFQSAVTPLSPEGEVQAQKLAERLKDTTFDEFWSSPMTRAAKTAEFINLYHHLDINYEPLLSEMKRATSLHGQSISDTRYKDISRMFEHNDDFDPYSRFEDGESFIDVIDRCQKIVKLLEKRASQVPEDHVLCITTHGVMLATLYMVILLGKFSTPEIIVDGLRRLRTENTSLTLMRLSQNGQWRVLTFSDYAHL